VVGVTVLVSRRLLTFRHISPVVTRDYAVFVALHLLKVGPLHFINKNFLFIVNKKKAQRYAAL